MMTEDDQLMLAVQEGDQRAFERLVALHERPLIGFFFRNTHDRQLSEDLTQETLLRIYNQAWNYLPRGRFRGWLFRIARNLLVDTTRRRSHDLLLRSITVSPGDDRDILAGLAGEFLGPDERARHAELASLVDEILDQLPDEQRQTFTLHHFAGLTLSEVADVMEAPLPTCKSRLRLARQKLQQKLRQKGVEPPACSHQPTQPAPDPP